MLTREWAELMAPYPVALLGEPPHTNPLPPQYKKPSLCPEQNVFKSVLTCSVLKESGGPHTE